MITEHVTKSMAIRIVYLDDFALFPILCKMPDLAVQRLSGRISRVSIHRALILRGLSSIKKNYTFSERTQGFWQNSKVIPLPSWLDQEIYKIADGCNIAMSEIAQSSLEIGLAELLSSQ